MVRPTQGPSEAVQAPKGKGKEVVFNDSKSDSAVSDVSSDEEAEDDLSEQDAAPQASVAANSAQQIPTTSDGDNPTVKARPKRREISTPAAATTTKVPRTPRIVTPHTGPMEQLRMRVDMPAYHGSKKIPNQLAKIRNYILNNDCLKDGKQPRGAKLHAKYKKTFQTDGQLKVNQAFAEFYMDLRLFSSETWDFFMLEWRDGKYKHLARLGKWEGKLAGAVVPPANYDYNADLPVDGHPQSGPKPEAATAGSVDPKESADVEEDEVEGKVVRRNWLGWEMESPPSRFSKIEAFYTDNRVDPPKTLSEFKRLHPNASPATVVGPPPAADTPPDQSSGDKTDDATGGPSEEV